MALDGMVIADIVYELERDLAGGRIAKIAQPEKDEQNRGGRKDCSQSEKAGAFR